jgi:hypothetical protein
MFSSQVSCLNWLLQEAPLKKHLRWLAIGMVITAASLQSQAQLVPGSTTAPAAAPESQIEIYRIAPGKQEAFLKFIALCDQANKEAGMAPRQLYVHQDGANWDFILIQPLHNTPEQNKAWFAAATRLGIPHGGNFFLAIRQFITEHSDTGAEGPTTAEQWLQQLHP